MMHLIDIKKAALRLFLAREGKRLSEPGMTCGVNCTGYRWKRF